MKVRKYDQPYIKSLNSAILSKNLFLGQPVFTSSRPVESLVRLTVSEIVFKQYFDVELVVCHAYHQNPNCCEWD